MSVEIVWPGERRRLLDSEIEKWFLEAVVLSMIEPEDFHARTAQQKAVALEKAGIIRLAGKYPL